MDEVNRLWRLFQNYCNTAEQHEFPFLLYMDLKLSAFYEDLQKNYTEEHAAIFIRCIKRLLDKLGVKEGT